MTCRDLADFLMDYDEGALSPEVRTAFDRHVSACGNCGAYLAQYRETIKAGRLAFDPATELRDAPEELVQAIIAARTRQ
jgi:anti-sigma factor RsiW